MPATPNEYVSPNQQRLDAVSSQVSVDYDEDECVCPLGGQLLTDPVTLPSGQTVEREMILQVIKATGQNPYTRKALSKDDLMPNAALKDKIETLLADAEKAVSQQQANLSL